MSELEIKQKKLKKLRIRNFTLNTIWYHPGLFGIMVDCHLFLTVHKL